MPLFNSSKIKHVANQALTFSTLYLATGLIINALGPIAGSLYGFFMTREKQCENIALGHKIGKAYFFPLTETYKRVCDAAHSNSSPPSNPK